MARHPSTRQRESRAWHRRDLWIAVGLTLITLTMTLSPGVFSAAGPAHQHLGAEYYSIARALVDGRGFSDPFGEATGSTAWMPPLYPFLLAGLLWALGKKSLVAIAVLVLTNVSLVGIGLAIYRMTERAKPGISPLFSLGLYLIWLCAFHYWFFQFTHDVWLLALFTAVVALQVAHHVETGEVRLWKWGLTGGFACGVSPAIATAWGTLTLLGILRLRHQRRTLCWAAALAFALATPWMVRNAVVFEQFIPVKSNYFFDAYQANYVDEDGLIDPRTTLEHPHQCYETRFRYGQLDETAFMEEFRSKYVSSVRDNPGVLFTNSARRALTATLWYSPFLDVDAGLSLALRRLVFAMPFLGFLLALGGRNRRLIAVLGVYYFSYLVPYVLTTMHIRYLLPLTPLAVFFAASGLARLVPLIAAIGAPPRGETTTGG